jgi:ABC-type tungstate transport system permease subunit
MGYAFTKKIRHISRRNIANNYKIVINSPDVHFGIKGQHAEVEHKNVFIVSCKNHLVRFRINGKQFIIKDLLRTFCNFWYRS